MNKIAKCIVIDAGKNHVKIGYMVNGVPKAIDSFPSVTQELLNDEIELTSSKSWICRHGDSIYGIGEAANSILNYDSSKNNLHSILLVNTALFKYCNDGETVKIVIGSPTNDATKVKYRDEFANYIKQNGEVKLSFKEYNSLEYVEKTITIEQVLVVAEGKAFRPRGLYNRELVEKRKRKEIGLLTNENSIIVIDIGGRNANVYEFLNNQCSNKFSLDDAGINTLSNIITSAISQNSSSRYTYKNLNIERCIQARKLPPEYGGDSIIKVTTNNFITNNIIGPIMHRNINLRQKGYVILLTGGVSKLLQEPIKELIDNDVRVSETAFWDNLISFMAAAIGKFKEDNINENGEDRTVENKIFLLDMDVTALIGGGLLA